MTFADALWARTRYKDYRLWPAIKRLCFMSYNKFFFQQSYSVKITRYWPTRFLSTRLRRAPAWRLHLKLCKSRNTPPNNSRIKNNRDLILGQVVYIIYHPSYPLFVTFIWIYRTVAIFRFDHTIGQQFIADERQTYFRVANVRPYRPMTDLPWRQLDSASLGCSQPLSIV